MSYVSRAKLLTKGNPNLESIFLTARLKAVELTEGGVSINFLTQRPDRKYAPNDVLFHFNLRPNNRLILNTCHNGAWQPEVYREECDLQSVLFDSKFELALKNIEVNEERDKSEFDVYLNNEFLTTYSCPLDIRQTQFVGFSPGIRIYV